MGDVRGEVPGVAAKDFVTSLTAEEHLRILLTGSLANQIAGDGGRVGDRVIEMPDHSRQQIDNFRLQNYFLMIGIELPRQFPRVANVVRLAFEALIFVAETDGEGLEWFCGKRPCDCEEAT